MASIRENDFASANSSTVDTVKDTPVMPVQNERFSIVTETLTFETFESIKEFLRKIFPRFQNESDPIINLMTCRNRRFFLPMLYTVIKLLRSAFLYNIHRLVSCLLNYAFDRPYNENDLIWILLNNMKTQTDFELMDDVSAKITFNTMIYCAMNGGQLFDWELEDESVLTYDEKIQLRLRLWLEYVKEDVLQCSTLQEVERIVQWIVKICFPYVSTTKNRVFIWDPFDEAWCLVTDLTKSLNIILQLIWSSLNEFMLSENVNEKHKICWSQIEPNWLDVAERMTRQEKEAYFKIIEDVYPIRQLKHKRIGNRLSIEHETANVPELYFLEERSMKLIPSD